MCWEIIARVNLGEFGTFNATHCFGKHKRCAPNPFFHDRVIIPHDSTASTTLAHRPLAHALFSFSCRAHSHAYRVASIDLHDRERSHAMMLNTMHVTRLRLLHTCPMACILSARPSPMPGPSVHTSNGQASSRHVHVWELSRRSCTRCARLRLARRRYSLRATTSRPSPMPCPCLSFCTLGELAPCAHVGAASHSRRTLS